MAVIRDIVPPSEGKPRPLGQRVGTKIAQVHRATQLSNLPHSRVVRRVQSMDILSPGLRVHPPKPDAKIPSTTALPVKPSAKLARPPQQPSRPIRPVPDAKPFAQPQTRPARRHVGRRLLEFAQYPLIAIVALAGAYSSTVGQGIIGLYALLALGLRWSSRYTFGAALLLLASVPGFQLIQQSGVAQNAAIYAYELLVVGTIQAIVELILDDRRAKRAAKTVL